MFKYINTIMKNMKVCPTCGTENPDEAVYCKKCGYKFPIVPAQPIPSPTTPSPQPTKRSNRPLLIGILAAVVIIVVIVGLILGPSIFSGNSLEAKASSIAAAANSNYGGNWNPMPNETYFAKISSNYEMKMTYLNGTTTTTFLAKSPISYVELSQLNLAGTELESFVLVDKTTSNNITIIAVKFSNQTVANSVFELIITSVQLAYSFAGITLNGTTMNGYVVYYYPGGTLNVFFSSVTIPGIAIAKSQTQIVFIQSNGVKLKTSFLQAVLSTIKP